jgi:xylan 1,4-beta-xylosidase
MRKGIADMEFLINNQEKGTDFQHYWEMCVGSCHAYTALREDYRKQLKIAHDELGFKYVRFHGIFDDDMCVCVEKKTHRGQSLGIVYNFVNIDNIFDFLISIGMKPFVELGFMPSCLASGDKTCFHYNANITPPKDYAQWRHFIEAFTKHILERYGAEEVRSWYFEVWNEPNLFFFFDGTQEDYFKLYEHTARAIKAVDENLRVGGPATSINAWIPEMINYCEQNKVPLDFISTHHYPSDDPLWKNSDMGLEEFFKKMGHLKRTYERGILKRMTLKARKEAGDYPLIYTEWNTSAALEEAQHDESYAAALVAKALSDNDGLVEGYAFWTFTDIFEEMSQIPGVFHGGFGLQTYNGVAKPTYRIFELFHHLGNERLSVESGTSEDDTVEILATRSEDGLRLIAYNHNVLDEKIKDENITITIENIEAVKEVRISRIDEEYANPKKAWFEMEKPEYVNVQQLEKLHEASELIEENCEFEVLSNNSIRLSLNIPAHGVCGIYIERLGEKS